MYITGDTNTIQDKWRNMNHAKSRRKPNPKSTIQDQVNVNLNNYPLFQDCIHYYYYYYYYYYYFTRIGDLIHEKGRI